MPIKDIDLDCTDCVLTTGFTPPCNPDSAGGNDLDIYIISTCNIESTEDGYTDNVISDITLSGSSFWYLVKAVPDSVTVGEVHNQQTGSFTYNISFQITAIGDGATGPEQAAAARAFVEAVSNPYEKFSVVIRSNHGNGIRYLYGESARGLRIADGTEYQSQGTDEDLAGFTLNLSGSGNLARAIADSVVLPTS